MIFKNSKHYDILRWVSCLVIPALGTLYFALASIWGLPYGEAVEGTCLALTTFLCTILQISKNAYDKQQEAEDGKGL